MEFIILFWVAVLSFCGGYMYHRMKKLIPSGSASLVFGSKKKLERRTRQVLSSLDEPIISDFVGSLDLTPSTLGIHLSAASHFRKSGEVEKAILIHKTILENSDLVVGRVDEITYELAKDYIASGLLDRAESLLLTLLTVSEFRKKVIEHLVSIYQSEKEWDKAIRMGELREVKDDRDYVELLAHFECEKAEQALQSGNISLAQASLTASQNYVKHFPRARLIALDIALCEQDQASILRVLNAVFKEGTELEQQVAVSKITEISSWNIDQMNIPEVLSPFIYQGKGGGKAIRFLADYYLRNRNVEKALSLLERSLEVQPSEQTIAILMDTVSTYSPMFTSDEYRKIALTVKAAIEKLNHRTPEFQCSNCGYAGNRLHWMCPGCHKWGTFRAYQAPSNRHSLPFLNEATLKRNQHEY